ncbi:MAG: OmpH family outer membrane protein [Candidatus Cloacimonetes bacterium]|nr:OmpH family outer membrane protein [Candidatus Cloacimonadota bacterium]
MKRFVLVLAALSMLTLGMAQAVKIGYVDTDRLLFESNEAMEIQRLFNLDRQNWSNQLRAINEEIRSMEQDYEIDRLTKNEAAKREALARIDTKKAEAGQMLNDYFGEGGLAEQRYNELIDPLTAKIREAIDKVAKNEKYTIIFDVSYPTVLYAAPSIDITDIILMEINKDTIAPQILDEEEPILDFDGLKDEAELKPEDIENLEKS